MSAGFSSVVRLGHPDDLFCKLRDAVISLGGEPTCVEAIREPLVDLNRPPDSAVRLVIGDFSFRDSVVHAQKLWPAARFFHYADGPVLAKQVEVLFQIPVSIIMAPVAVSDLATLFKGVGLDGGGVDLGLFYLEFSILSRELGLIDRLHFSTGDWLFRRGVITSEYRRSLQLVFQEAIANSHEHGNLALKSEWKDDFDDLGRDRYSLERSVRLSNPEYCDRLLIVRSRFDGVSLFLEIEDQGSGFNTANLKEAPPSVDACYGRGLPLIRSYMDEVVFSKNGTRISMKKQIVHQVG